MSVEKAKTVKKTRKVKIHTSILDLLQNEQSLKTEGKD